MVCPLDTSRGPELSDKISEAGKVLRHTFATEVLLHWDDVKERNYELSRWNCQHFSRQLHDAFVSCRQFSVPFGSRLG